MFLKNYTSNVPVSVTLGRIRHTLIKCGVSGIMEEYHPSGNGKVIAVTFQIPTSDDEKMTVRLPADEEKALQAMWLDYANGEKLSTDGSALYYSKRKKKRRKDFQDQAQRTAWKIVQDWVEVQMSMIQLRQADTLQVFMPYLWNGKETMYQIAQRRGLRQLLPPAET